MVKRVLHNKQAVIGLFLILLVLTAAFFAPLVAPHDPEKVNVSNKYSGPSKVYPLGTDQLGRCELSRLLYGARYSICMSLPTIFMLSIIGLLLGSLSACAGKWVDRILIMICDIFIAFPALLIAAAIIGILGNGLQNIVIAIILAMWAWFTRIVRSYAVIEMGRDYILAARISGCSINQIIFRHLIPNVMPQFLVYISTGVASTIIMISSFSFLGLGLPSGVAEWGTMLNEARSSLYANPSLLVYPGICILITTAGFNLFGEALRDMLEPEEVQ